MVPPAGSVHQWEIHLSGRVHRGHVVNGTVSCGDMLTSSLRHGGGSRRLTTTTADETMSR